MAPYPQSTREPALGPLADDEDLRIYLVADLPGVAADGRARPDSFLAQCERAQVILQCVDAGSDAPDPRERIALVDAAVAGHMRQDARRLIVATHADPDDVPSWADMAVDSLSGAGIARLRAGLTAALEASAV